MRVRVRVLERLPVRVRVLERLPVRVRVLERLRVRDFGWRCSASRCIDCGGSC